MNECKFNMGWLGICKKPTESEMCVEHSNLKCCSCGAPATNSCTATMQFVCNQPLCEECTHEIGEDGTNVRDNKHCKKCDQKHLPWYARD